MRKELREMLAQLETMKTEVRSLMSAGKVDEAEAKMGEVRSINRQIEVQKQLDSMEESENREGQPVVGGNLGLPKDDAEYREAFWKAFRGQALTMEERALVTTTDADGGLAVPKDFQTKINDLKRQYKSMKALVGIYNTTTKSGSLTYEDLAGLTDLADLTEVTDVPERQPKFQARPYAVKDYGCLLPVSNTLLQDETGGVMDYIGRWFAKKAIRTENKKIFAKLAEGVTKKALADWQALKKSMNVDLDPLVSSLACICTNQDGFNVLDQALDGLGRPVLQPDPTNPTVKRFMGREVHVFSNAELPTVAGKAPIIYGAMEEAIKFIDRGIYECKASSEAGFTKNATMVRCIERFDVVKADADAYVYGELTIPA